MVFPGSPTSPFYLGRNPFGLWPKSLGEVGGLGETTSGNSAEVQVDGCSLYERSYDNCDRLLIAFAPACPTITWRLPFFLLKLRYGLRKNNNGTSSRYKCLPTEFTKCLLKFVPDDSVGGMFA